MLGVDVAVDYQTAQPYHQDRSEQGGGPELVGFVGAEGAVGGSFGEDPADRVLEAGVDTGRNVGEPSGAAQGGDETLAGGGVTAEMVQFGADDCGQAGRSPGPLAAAVAAASLAAISAGTSRMATSSGDSVAAGDRFSWAAAVIWLEPLRVYG